MGPVSAQARVRAPSQDIDSSCFSPNTDFVFQQFWNLQYGFYRSTKSAESALEIPRFQDFCNAKQLLPRTVMRNGPSLLQRAEIRTAAGEIVMDARQTNTHIDRR